MVVPMQVATAAPVAAAKVAATVTCLARRLYLHSQGIRYYVHCTIFHAKHQRDADKTKLALVDTLFLSLFGSIVTCNNIKRYNNIKIMIAPLPRLDSRRTTIILPTCRRLQGAVTPRARGARPLIALCTPCYPLVALCTHVAPRSHFVCTPCYSFKTPYYRTKCRPREVHPPDT